jgi:methylenetetrahydrofolate dehydrogenase (NADP+)/methenyltetrahydrofolate cyclohydrolase
MLLGVKLLNGSELAGFIKERQIHQVRALRQSKKVFPKLAIIQCGDDPASSKYIELKKNYAQDILIEVELHKIDQSDAITLIKTLNEDPSIHGIIVQLPLPTKDQTDEIVNSILPGKDVDSLGEKSDFDAATPMAIQWLLAGYNIDLRGKNIVLMGHGRLVGAPLKKMLENSGLSVVVIDENTEQPENILPEANVIISAVGKPGILHAEIVPNNAVIIDAGLTSENGVLKGDVADDVYERNDITITPKIGGVGPLTIAALFDNVIRSANKLAK